MIQVYTGDGKGKTTAAIGLAMRAAGAGLKVFICQFVKGRYCCELKSLKQVKNITVRQFGSNCFIKKAPDAKDMRLAKEGLAEISKIIKNKSCDLVVLDEINVALRLKLLQLPEVIRLLKDTPRSIELILTGRSAPEQILKIADLVSEIKEKKHYYKKGVKARRGIEF
jgi:cob(I)alamin adenosyltransferase